MLVPFDSVTRYESKVNFDLIAVAKVRFALNNAVAPQVPN
jgi:hypothetical protein